MTMGGRVYDPIHDVFQDSKHVQAESGVNMEATTDKPSLSNKDVSSNDVIDTGTTALSNSTISAISEIKKSNVKKSDKVNKLGSENEQEMDSNNSNSNNNNNNNNKRQRRVVAKFNRSIKKKDGDYLTRKDVQYSFFKGLLSDKREVFSNIFIKEYSNKLVPFRDLYDENGQVQVMNVTDKEFDARRFFTHKKLTFSQLYILCLATSKKSSKVLREKLLSDHNVAFSMCMLSLLVNVGKLNTTINFYPEMASQVRIFHSIPSLQYLSPNEKSLQDTPRLKCILKNLPIGNDPIDLEKLYYKDKKNEDREDKEPQNNKLPLYNVANMIFTICESPTFIKELLFKNEYFCGDNILDIDNKIGNLPNETNNSNGDNNADNNDDNNNLSFKTDTSIFTFLDTTKYTIKSRITVILWILYVLLETELDKTSIIETLKIFGTKCEDGEYRIELKLNKNGKDPDDEDKDSEEEIKVGELLRERRAIFLNKRKLDENENTDNNKDNDNNLVNAKENALSVKVDVKKEIPVTLKKKHNRTSSRPITAKVEKKNSDTMTDNGADTNKDEEDKKEKDDEVIKPLNDKSETKDILNNDNKSDDKIDTEIKTQTQTQLKTKPKTKTKTKSATTTISSIPLDKSSNNSSTDTTSCNNNDNNGTGQDEQGTEKNKDKKNNSADEQHILEVVNLIEEDKKRKVVGNKTQEDITRELKPIHELLKKRRQEIGMIKLFHDFEDNPIAPSLGVRGKKRKRYDDGYMGFETDYLKLFAKCKHILLSQDINKSVQFQDGDDDDNGKNTFRIE